MYIYKFTNLINGNVYVGQTKNSSMKRYKEHLRNSKKPQYAIHLAIHKYGITNFKFEVIDGANSASELTYKETHYIYKYNSLSPNGYNLQIGTNPSESIQRKVIAIDEVSGREILYKSVSACERILGIPRNTVYEILNGRREYKSIEGFLIKYADAEPIKKTLKYKVELPVRRICNRTKEIKGYLNANSTVIDGYNPDSIRNACQRSKKGFERNRKVGFRWEYISGR